LWSKYSPVKARSVPFCRITRSSSGESGLYVGLPSDWLCDWAMFKSPEIDSVDAAVRTCGASVAAISQPATVSTGSQTILVTRRIAR
jgi:hypothetical protein